jgi:integrase
LYTHSTPAPTAEDLLAMLGSHAGLSAIRRRDMISAVRRVCDIVGCPPSALHLDPVGLRKRLADVKPAAHSVSAKTWANIRSLFAAALEDMGVVEPLRRGLARRDPHWSALVAAIADNKRLASGLAALLNWCAERGITPAEVDDEILQRFFRWLEGRTLHANPRAIVWNIPGIWNEAAALVPGWPPTKLTAITFRTPSPNILWRELPESFRADADAYLDLRRRPDPFDTDPRHPQRPLAESTLRQQREHIRLAASVILRKGEPGQNLAALAELVTPTSFKEVLRHYHDRAGRRPNAFAILMAKTLIDVARYSVKASEAELLAMKTAAAKLPAAPHELTEKNKDLLHTLEDTHVRSRLLFLPGELRRKVEAALKRGQLRFVDAQVAVAIDILLVAPLRMENLSRLNWRLNFREPEGPRGRLVIYVPKAETKSGKRDLTFEIPPELAANIRWYRNEILPRLGHDRHGDLFVARHAGRKARGTLAEQIVKCIAKHVGIHMTPHQFRHFAACLYLEEHPEDFQSVTDLLGHAWSKTTLIYAGSPSRRASRAYARHLVEQRESLRTTGRGRKRRFPGEGK